MKRQKKTFESAQNGQQVANAGSSSSPSRFHVDYWRGRLFKKVAVRKGVRHEVKTGLSVRLQHLGRRETFSLGTDNSSVAAAKAKEIAVFLEANAWAPTLVKYKPSPLERLKVCSVGEFLADVEARSHLKPISVRRYGVKLRKIVADLAKVGAGRKSKANRAKYDYLSGGRAAWLAEVDGQPVDLLTPESVNAWRNQYVAKAGASPVKRKSAERSAASCLRCARALFAADVVALLKVKLPPYPFLGVKLKDPGPQRYHSEINPEWLLGCAERELRQIHPQLYLAFSLCLWGGLRRKEADLLMWNQIDFQEGQIHVRRTDFFEPKTEESQRKIDVPKVALDAFRPFKAGSHSEFVLDGFAPNPSATYDYYRCGKMWRELNAWLQKKGIRQQKAIHALRKESGSLIAAKFGIEAARYHLGHRDISTTSAHYVSKKRRAEVNLAAGKLRAVGDEEA